MVIGLDLATRITGAAAVRPAPHVLLQRAEPLRVAPSVDGARKILDWLLPHRPDLVVVERPPMVVSKDVAHGSQAAIGYALGRMSGLVEGMLHAHRVPYVLVDVGDWRDTMLATSTRMGVPASKPGTQPKPTPMFGARQRVRLERTDGQLEAVYECGHRRPVPSIDALPRIASCPKCSATPPEMKRSDWVRGEWKRLACELVRAHWPGPYAELVATARAAARTDKADHELVGVSDAAEAVWIAVHGVCGTVPA